mmetsp:Transcript_31071/g.43049  ORF Transcript_31071/g.43049 Transcript_31071/m.43049 type:complete len:201 (-) Transcript_31071:803-1405(-)
MLIQPTLKVLTSSTSSSPPDLFRLIIFLVVYTQTASLVQALTHSHALLLMLLMSSTPVFIPVLYLSFLLFFHLLLFFIHVHVPPTAAASARAMRLSSLGRPNRRGDSREPRSGAGIYSSAIFWANTTHLSSRSHSHHVSSPSCCCPMCSSLVFSGIFASHLEGRSLGSRARLLEYLKWWRGRGLAEGEWYHGGAPPLKGN